jgi:hypothetical protein
MEFGCEPVAQSSDHHSSWVRDQFHSLLNIKAALEAGGSNSLGLPNKRTRHPTTAPIAWSVPFALGDNLQGDLAKSNLFCYCSIDQVTSESPYAEPKTYPVYGGR